MFVICGVGSRSWGRTLGADGSRVLREASMAPKAEPP